MPKLTKKSYLGGLVVTVSSHSKPKQVREVFKPVKSFKEAVNIAIANAWCLGNKHLHLLGTKSNGFIGLPKGILMSLLLNSSRWVKNN